MAWRDSHLASPRGDGDGVTSRPRNPAEPMEPPSPESLPRIPSNRGDTEAHEVKSRQGNSLLPKLSCSGGAFVGPSRLSTAQVLSLENPMGKRNPRKPLSNSREVEYRSRNRLVRWSGERCARADGNLVVQPFMCNSQVAAQ